MRKFLLTSATLLSVAALPAFVQPAFAQTSAPDTAQPDMASPSAPVAPPDAGTATGAPAAGMTAPKPRHHHHAASQAAGSDDQTFAHEPGTGQSGPASMKASNISESDSHSPIAPHFPQPRGGMNAGPQGYLRDADRALAMHHTGEAQQALEMAETRLLDRSTPVNMAGQPSQSPMVQQVSQARRALGAGDIAGARSAIRMALSSAPPAGMAGEDGASMPSGGMAPAGTGMGATSQPGGAPMGTGAATGPTMSPSGAGPIPGNTAGAAVGGGAAGAGTADSAGGAK